MEARQAPVPVSPQHFIAVDLGAGSGRVMLGSLAAGSLTLVESHRFQNRPLRLGDTLRWDIDTIEREVRTGIEGARAAAAPAVVRGIGVDSWGVDYVLMDAEGHPVVAPYHYRDARTEGVMERLSGSVGRWEIFRRTGIQFVPFNTLYQLAAQDAECLKRAERLLMTADYFGHRLGGGQTGEVTLASTSQMVDARRRDWSDELLKLAGLQHVRPLLAELVEAGTRTGQYGDVPVIATASHDTASAVVGCPGRGTDWAFLSSGTWMLLGVELSAPALTREALEANLSNELGIAGTTRLLRNIMGLWLLQQCQEDWNEAGLNYTWERVVAEAEQSQPLSVVIDPDDGRFFTPGGMTGKIDAFCRQTGQAPPSDPGAMARAVLESLALKCRWVLERLEEVTGRRIRTINMIGGGVQNRLLCRMTAEATGRRVVAGPVEATAAGNVLTQAIGVGAVSSLTEAREILTRSFETVEYEPGGVGTEWDEAYGRLEEMLDRKEGL